MSVKRVSLMSFVVGFSLLFCLSNSFAQTIILQDNFENADTSDWQKTTSAIIVPTTSYKHSGNYSGVMSNSESGGCGYEGPGKYAPVYKEFTPQTGVFTIEFWGMSDGTGGAYNMRAFGFSDQQAYIESNDPCQGLARNSFFVGAVFYEENNQFGYVDKCFGDVHYHMNLNYTPYTWDLIKFDVEVPKQQYTIYINGTNVGTYPFCRNVSSIRYFVISSEYKNVYVDDLTIYNNLAPTCSDMGFTGTNPNPTTWNQSPGESISGSFDYKIWNMVGGNALMLILVAIEDSDGNWVGGEPKCVYGPGLPGQCEANGDSGTANFVGLMVPSTPGTYNVIAYGATGYDCADITNKYKNHVSYPKFNLGVLGICLMAGAPTLSSPLDGATGVSRTPMLDWGDVSGTTSYDVEVCSDNGCGSVVRSSSVLGSSQWVVAPALNNGATYYWRARASNSCGKGLWSSSWSFTTVTTPALENWNHRYTVSGAPDLYAVTFGNDLFVVVGTQGKIVTSPDGINWTERVSGTTSILWGVTYASGKFVAVGASGTVLTSSDGENWTPGNSGITVDLFGVSYGNGTFVATCGCQVITSTDGIAWSSPRDAQVPCNTPEFNWLGEIVYGNGLFVAGGHYTTIVTSPDAASWTLRKQNIPPLPVFGLGYGNGMFVAVGACDYGGLMSSPNGIDWTDRPLVDCTQANLHGAGYGNGTFVVVGDYGYLFSSPDGINWTRRDSGTSTNIWSVGFGKDTFVIAGTNGMIWQSDPIKPPLTISGRVTSGGKGLANVTMSGLPGNIFTLIDGSYSGAVDEGWSGTVTPVKVNCLFNPISSSYNNVVSSHTQDYIANVEKFNKITWGPVADMLGTNQMLGTAVLNGKIYAVGGHRGYGGYLKEAAVYDPAINPPMGQWQRIADLNHERTYPGAAAFNDTIWAVNGNCCGGPIIDSIEIYYPGEDRWYYSTEKGVPFLGAPQDNLNRVVTLNNKLYVVGGASGAAPTETVLSMWDGSVWNNLKPIPKEMFYSSAVVANGEIYLIGGDDLSGRSGSTYIYNPATDQWREGPSLVVPRANSPAVAVAGRIFVLGGNGTAGALDSVEMLDLSAPNPTWKVLEESKLTFARCWHSAAVLNDEIYIMGGLNQLGQAVSTVEKGILSFKHLKPKVVDFDRDGKTDVAVYDKSSGWWWIIPSGGSAYGVGWGGDASDIPVPGDYDGDGKTDVAVYRGSTGVWWITPSSGAPAYGVGWGDPSFTPVPGDYDGDGRTDVATYDSITGVWWIIPSSGTGAYGIGWGGPAFKPVPGDYDGDGKTDIAIYESGTGVWWIIPSSGAPAYGIGWGGPAFRPVPADYDGDGKTDIAIYDSGTGAWWIIPSSGVPAYGIGWGGPVYAPVPGDYDGDGKADIAIYEASTGAWWIIPSSGAPAYGVGWGGTPDYVPVTMHLP